MRDRGAEPRKIGIARGARETAGGIERPSPRRPLQASCMRRVQMLTSPPPPMIGTAMAAPAQATQSDDAKTFAAATAARAFAAATANAPTSKSDVTPPRRGC